MLIGKAVRGGLASFLGFAVTASPIGSGTLQNPAPSGGSTTPDSPSLVGSKGGSSRAKESDPPPVTQPLQPWLISSRTLSELRAPDLSPKDPFEALTPPPVLSLFSNASPHNPRATRPVITKRIAREALKTVAENGLIDPDTAKKMMQELRWGKVLPDQIASMATTVSIFEHGPVGKTLSKVEIQAAVWLGYIAGTGGRAGEPVRKGPEGVIGYLQGMNERINEELKGNDIVIDPRGRGGFLTYYLSVGAPAVLWLTEERTVDSVPRAVQLTLSLSEKPWTEQIQKLIKTKPGDCVTAVLLTLAENKIPNPFATSLEVGNNPVGLAAQLVRDFGLISIDPSNGKNKPVKIISHYGEFEVSMMTAGEFLKAAYLGEIPLYSIVFQTAHPSWVIPSKSGKPARPAASEGSTGFDAAIAIPSDEKGRPFDLWNGRRNGLFIYGSATTQIFVLTPHKHGVKNGDPIQELLLASQGLKNGTQGRAATDTVASR